jgi:hypothetical protein
MKDNAIPTFTQVSSGSSSFGLDACRKSCSMAGWNVGDRGAITSSTEAGESPCGGMGGDQQHAVLIFAIDLTIYISEPHHLNLKQESVRYYQQLEMTPTYIIRTRYSDIRN